MKRLLNLCICLSLCFVLSSCYTYSFSVGDGAQTGLQSTGKNTYLIYGLVPIKTEDPSALAGGAENYDVLIQHTFIDGLVNAITFGIFNPVTVTVTK